MVMRISDEVRNAAAAAAVDLINGGSAEGYIEIRTGTQPAGGPEVAASGTLLVTIPLNDPAFGSPSSGAVSADVDPEPEGIAVADGTAGWFRVYDSNDTALIDGAVGSDMTINTTSINTGVVVRITGYTITVPSGV